MRDLREQCVHRARGWQGRDWPGRGGMRPAVGDRALGTAMDEDTSEGTETEWLGAGRAGRGGAEHSY